MNYFKAAEQLLAALPELERAVENLKHREDRIVNSGAPKMPAAIDYAKPFADVTSINDTLSEMLALTEVQRNRHKTESQIAEIKRILAQMEAEHQALITNAKGIHHAVDVHRIAQNGIQPAKSGGRAVRAALFRRARTRFCVKKTGMEI